MLDPVESGCVIQSQRGERGDRHVGFRGKKTENMRSIEGSPVV
jgi:hypothetical protein